MHHALHVLCLIFFYYSMTHCAGYRDTSNSKALPTDQKHNGVFDRNLIIRSPDNPLYGWWMWSYLKDGTQGWQVRTIDRSSQDHCPKLTHHMHMYERGGEVQDNDFPIKVCVWDVPEGVVAIEFAHMTLKKPSFQGEIGILGNTACFAKACVNTQDRTYTSWVFPSLAEALSYHVGLLVHTGNYIHGPDHWDNWELQFFAPLSKIHSAVWLFMRGSEEGCQPQSHKKGWSLLLSSDPYHPHLAPCTEQESPQWLAYGQARIASIDNTHGNGALEDMDKVIEPLRAKDPLWRSPLLFTHVPLLGVRPECQDKRFATQEYCHTKHIPNHANTLRMLSTLKNILHTPQAMIISGHIPILDFLTFEKTHLQQWIVGNGGKPFPDHFLPYTSHDPGRSIYEFHIRHSNTETRPGFLKLRFGKSGIDHMRISLMNDDMEALYTVHMPYQYAFTRWVSF